MHDDGVYRREHYCIANKPLWLLLTYSKGLECVDNRIYSIFFLVQLTIQTTLHHCSVIAIRVKVFSCILQTTCGEVKVKCRYVDFIVEPCARRAQFIYR